MVAILRSYHPQRRDTVLLKSEKKKVAGYSRIVLLIFKKRVMGNAQQDVAMMMIIPNVVTIVYCIKIQP